MPSEEEMLWTNESAGPLLSFLSEGPDCLAGPSQGEIYLPNSPL